MQIESIPIARLHPHPDNSNVMPEPLLAKLAANIARSDRYPPVIVRPLPTGEHTEMAYQILDGHHRVEALRRLQHDTARCVVWDVDDDEAMLLVATLNRLEGTDDARKRAALVGKLSDRHELKALADRLPERTEQLKKLLTLAVPAPPPRPAPPIEAMPQAVHFFLLPEQRRRLDAALRDIGGAREAALMTMVERYLEADFTKGTSCHAE